MTLKSNLKSTKNVKKKYDNFTSTDKLIEGFSGASEFFIKLITYWLPKLVTNLISFLKNFVIKIVKTFILIIPGFFIVQKLVRQYWSFLLPDDVVNNPNHSFLIEYPTLFGGAYLWWMNTNTLGKFQNLIFSSVLPLLYTLKFFFIFLAGVPQDDPFFQYKGKNFIKQQELFMNMIKPRIFEFVIRFILFTYLISGIVNRRYLEVRAISIPTEKEILILPLLMLRRYITYVFTIIYTTVISVFF